MQRAIEEMHADGQAISSLFPFKTSYYEMFGYAGWQVPMYMRIKPAALAPYLKVPKTGTVRHRHANDAKDDAYALVTAAQQTLHGMSRQPREKFDAALKWGPMWFMSVHEGDNVTGGMSYKLDPDKKVMEVHAAFWLTENAKVQTLDYLARHVDQVDRIAMPLLPGEQPHLWMTDDDAITISSVEDHAWNAPMARIVSVAGLNGIGAGDGSVALSIQDAQAPWNTGSWTFTGRNGVLDVTEGGEPAGEVSITGLSALVMSGIDPVALPYRGWGEVGPQAANALRALFPPVVPHLHDQF
jgi:predicted acetyltransferase